MRSSFTRVPPASPHDASRLAMTHDASTALQNVDVNVTASDTEREDAETTSTKREQIQTTTATGADLSLIHI